MRTYIETLIAYRELKRLIKNKGKKDDDVNGWTYKNFTYSEQSESSTILFYRESNTDKKNKLHEIVNILGVIYYIVDGKRSPVRFRTLKNYYNLIK